MKKKIPLAVVSILASILVAAQTVGINNNNPDASAILDVKSNTKGMLIPRTSTISRLAILNPAKGLMLYDTITSSFWFHNGSAWTEISAAGNVWSLTGNSATNPSTNFIGTTDIQSLRFKVNNLWAGQIHPSSGNTSFGSLAGQSTTSGLSNTSMGFSSLNKNTIGYENTSYGSNSLFNNTTASRNTAIGTNALFTQSFNNFGVSWETANVAVGYNALYLNQPDNEVKGNFNTAVGSYALQVNTNGSVNTALGYASLVSNTTGSGNTATGNSALYSTTSGTANTGIGSLSMHNNSIGYNNTAVGSETMFFTTVGHDNVAIGRAALANNNGGSYNIAIGVFAGNGGQNLNNTIGIGNDNYLPTLSNQVLIGNASTSFIGGAVNFVVNSDARIKNTIEEDVKGLDFILLLRPVTYHVNVKAISTITEGKETMDFPEKYDREKDKYTGFIAQEVEQAAKSAGYDFSGVYIPKKSTELYGLRYAEFVVPLVKAMQEQQAMIKTQQQQIDLLLKRIEALEKK